jgi:hypothetical protein
LPLIAYYWEHGEYLKAGKVLHARATDCHCLPLLATPDCQLLIASPDCRGFVMVTVSSLPIWQAGSEQFYRPHGLVESKLLPMAIEMLSDKVPHLLLHASLMAF